MFRAASKILYLLVLLGAFAFAMRVEAQTPPQGMDLTTGMDYACEANFGYVGCEQRMHPGARHIGAPLKPDVWSAIAVSPSSLAWEVHWSSYTRKDAQDAAMAACAKRASDCVIVAAVADVCVALVTSGAEKIYKIGGPTGAANFAEDNGRLQCERAGGRACRVETAFCADGLRHDLKGKTVFSNGNPIFVPEGSHGPFGRH